MFIILFSFDVFNVDLVPAISVSLHSFITSSLIATSLVSAILTLSSVSLTATNAVTNGHADTFITQPSRNLLVRATFCQKFSNWILSQLTMNKPEYGFWSKSKQKFSIQLSGNGWTFASIRVVKLVFGEPASRIFRYDKGSLVAYTPRKASME